MASPMRTASPARVAADRTRESTRDQREARNRATAQANGPARTPATPEATAAHGHALPRLPSVPAYGGGGVVPQPAPGAGGYELDPASLAPGEVRRGDARVAPPRHGWAVRGAAAETRLLSRARGLAGLAGIAEVSGAIGQLRPVISPGYGFTAIIVAYLGRLHPIGILLAGLLIAAAL